MELEDRDPLRRQRPLSGEKLIERALKSKEARRIRAQAEIDAKRSNRGAITDSETGVLHHVIEILEITLPEPEVDIAQLGVNVPHVVEQNASDVIANQWKTQLGGVEQQRIAADRKRGLKLCRPSLI